MRWDRLSSPEARRHLDRGAVALWPIGATEAHGPHLPLSTDVVIAEETCRRAVPAIAERHGLSAWILPPLGFSVADFAGPFAGTLSLPRETSLAYVRDTALAAARHGFRAVCLVNAHLEPAHRFTLRDAIKAANAAGPPAPIGIADPADARFADGLTEEFKSGSCHAGQYETSLIMAADPALVREEQRAELPALEIDLVAAIRGGAKSFADAGAAEAYCGDPRGATVAEGEESYRRLVAMVLQVIGELLAPRRDG
jgi:creatinine amidohydrolase